MQNFQTKLKELWEKVKGFFKKLNKKTLILLGVCAVVILAIFILLIVRMNRKEYAVLKTGLTASETSTIISFLTDNGVTDYRVQNDSILVPAGREVQLQSQLALSGYSKVGFLYDYYNSKVGLTSTSTEEMRAWQVSIQERLEATIRTFEGVQDAHVTINPGTTQIYLLQDNVTPSSASVVIELDGNQPLKDNVVTAIRDTVSHSVERLNIENVSIHDNQGNPYSDNSTLAQSGQATALKLEYEERISNNVRRELLNSLGSIYGPDNVSVSVLCDVDVSRKIVDKTTHEQPDGSVIGGGLIINDKVFWEVIRDGSDPVGGTVGTTTNSDIPTQPDMNEALNGDQDYVGSSTDREGVVDITKTQMEVLEGRLTDLRVTVTVNQNCENAGAMTIDALRDHVATLAGIGSEDPLSRVHVTIAPFAKDNIPVPGGPGGIFSSENSWILYAAIAGLVLFLVLLLLVILLSRRSRKRKLARQQALEEEMMAAAAEAEAAAILAAAPPTGGADIMEVNTEKSMELRKTIRQFAQNNPEIAAQMVKAWLKGEDTNG